MDKLAKVRDEIEKLKSQLLRGACSSQIAMETHCKEEAYNEVLAILDTMQEEPVSEDLEKAAIEAFKHIVDSDKNSFLEIFKAGAKWQAEQEYTCYEEAFEDGAKWKKEQMMKDAIDTELDDVCGFLTISIPYHNGIAGDKIKVIIIKSE